VLFETTSRKKERMMKPIGRVQLLIAAACLAHCTLGLSLSAHAHPITVFDAPGAGAGAGQGTLGVVSAHPGQSPDSTLTGTDNWRNQAVINVYEARHADCLSAKLEFPKA
jgi:hypothetical protein